MPETPEFLAARLKTEGEKTFLFFESLRPEQWQALIYTEGETWAVRNVLAHFVTAEEGFIRIFSDILNEGSGVKEDFDIDRFNASMQRRTQQFSALELLEKFRNVRAQMIALVASIPENDLLKQGRHPYLGQTTLAEMIKMVYRHNQIHFRDMRKVIHENE